MRNASFAILQDSKTKRSWVYDEHGKWTCADTDEYEIISLIARLIRCGSIPPRKVLQEFKIQVKKIKDDDTPLPPTP